MIIKSITYQNMFANPNEVTISFLNKMPSADRENFFESTIVDKPRSTQSKNALLKTIALIGKNASYKTSTVIAISKVVNFVTTFKKNAKNAINSFAIWNNEDARQLVMEWYAKKNSKQNVNFPRGRIHFQKILNDFIEDKANNEYVKQNYINYFLDTNAFSDEKELAIKIVFLKDKNTELEFETKLFKDEDREVIMESTLNNKQIDLYELQNEEILNFQTIFASINRYDTSGSRFIFRRETINRYLETAVEYLYFESFKGHKNKLVKFLKVLDPSIKDIEYQEFKQLKSLNLISVFREISTALENIPPSKLSSGTKLFIVYLYYILKYDFIVFDEIEQSLHIKLVELLLDIARENNKQMVFTTHDPIVIEKFLKKYQVYILEPNNDNELFLNKANKIFRDRENFLIKHLKDLVSSIPDSDLDFLRAEFYE